MLLFIIEHKTDLCSMPWESILHYSDDTIKMTSKPKAQVKKKIILLTYMMASGE